MTISADPPSLRSALVAAGLVTDEPLRSAVAEQRASGRRLVEVLLTPAPGRPAVPEQALLRVLADTFGLEVVSLGAVQIPADVLSRVPSDLAVSRQVLPLAVEGSSLKVAVADPLDLSTQDDLRMLTGLAVRPVLAPLSEIRRATERFYMARMLQDAESREGGAADTADEALDVADLQKMAQEELIIQLVNLIINQAIQDRASDIHVEPFERELSVRYRIDGILHDGSSPPKRLHPAIVSRIKILSDMNIAERRLPQDGRMRLQSSGRQIDVRVSTIPSLYGESVVMRILDRSSALLTLEELGMRSDALARFRQLISPPRDPAGDGPDGKREDDLPLRGAERDLLAGAEDHHYRGSGRVPALRRHTDAGPPADRADVRQRPPAHRPAGPGRHHGR
jgi:type IV pilus assembly protein PilB